MHRSRGVVFARKVGLLTHWGAPTCITPGDAKLLGDTASEERDRMILDNGMFTFACWKSECNHGAEKKDGRLGPVLVRQEGCRERGYVLCECDIRRCRVQCSSIETNEVDCLTAKEDYGLWMEYASGRIQPHNPVASAWKRDTFCGNPLTSLAELVETGVT